MVIELQKAKINFEINKDFNPQNVTLIFIHGFTGCAEDWKEVISQIPTSFNKIAIDLPGFGKSDVLINPKYYKPKFLIQIILALINQFELEKIILVGYSLGGRLAISFAVDYSYLLNGLVLESTTAGIESKTIREERIQNDFELAKFIKTNSLEKFVEYWLNLEIFKTQKSLSTKKLVAIKERKLKLNKIGLINSLNEFGTGKMNSLWNKLNKISCPVLLISGNLDKKFSEIHSLMTDKIPNVKKLNVENCGHNVHLEKPKVFVNLINNFLETIRSI